MIWLAFFLSGLALGVSLATLLLTPSGPAIEVETEALRVDSLTREEAAHQLLTK